MTENWTELDRSNVAHYQRRPAEVVETDKRRADAWRDYDRYVEECERTGEFVQSALERRLERCEQEERNYTAAYNRWQAAIRKSEDAEIDSILEPLKQANRERRYRIMEDLFTEECTCSPDSTLARRACLADNENRHQKEMV